MCCRNGKVDICHMALIDSPPELLYSLFKGDSNKSRHFLNNITYYNSIFQMTSFGATDKINLGGFKSTFKVQGQVYHRLGSLNVGKDKEVIIYKFILLVIL